MLARLQHRHQRAGACGFDVLDLQLVFRLPAQGGDAAGGDDLHPLFGAHGHAGDLALPADRGDDRAVILEVEIHVARARDGHAADLAAHADAAEFALEHAFDRARKLGDGEFMRVRRGGVFERSMRHRGAPCLPVTDRP
jgi:hypothetical protein